MKQDCVRIDYPGSCISVNHYLGRRKGGGYYVTEETKNFKMELQWLLKHCHLKNYKLPLEVKCDGWFKDERSAPDLSNLSKVVLDAIQELIGGNDKDYRWHDGKRIIGESHPYLIISISENPTMPAVVPSKSKSSGIEGESSIQLHKTRKRGIKSYAKSPP